MTTVDVCGWGYDLWTSFCRNYCKSIDDLHIPGCCCPSENNSDSWNSKMLCWVKCLYNKVPTFRSKEQMNRREGQFFQDHKFSFDDVKGIKDKEYWWCCKPCGWKYCPGWESWKKKSCGHSIYTCFSEPLPWGLFNICCPWFRVQKLRTILLAGLQNSGKTFLMRKLLVQTGDERLKPETGPSTQGFVDTVVTFNLWQKYEIFEIGGSEVQRQFWRTYYSLMVKFDTVVYCINANDYLQSGFKDELVNTERQELHKLLASPELRRAQIIVYMVFDEALNLNWKAKETKSCKCLHYSSILRFNLNNDVLKSGHPVSAGGSGLRRTRKR